MVDIMVKDCLEIQERCKEQGIDTEGCLIYLRPNNLNGNYCLKGTLSHDEFWMCIPEFDEAASAFVGEEVYIPTCYEVKNSFKTYLKSDSMYHLVEGFILYDRK